MHLHEDIAPLLAEARRLEEVNPARALELAQQALRLAEQSGDPAGQAASLLQSGVCRSKLASFLPAQADFTRALELYCAPQAAGLQDEGRLRGEAAALDGLGECAGELGDNARALEYHLQSLARWQQSGDPLGLARCLNHLGIRYYYFAQFYTALEYYQQSLALCEQSHYPSGIAHGFNNLAIIYDKFGDYERAVEYYRRSARIFEEMDSPIELTNTLLNLGAMLEECLHQPEQARELFQRGLKLVKGSNKLLEALCYHELGNLERGVGEYPRARAYYYAALDLLGETGSSELMAEVLVDLGRCQLAQPDLDGALASLRQSLDLAQLSQANETIFLAHQWLSAACEQKGDFAGALRHFQEFHRVRDEVYSAQTELQVKGLTIKAETEKSRQEAEIARKEAEIARQETVIYRLKHEELTRAHRDLQIALEQNNHLVHELQLKAEDLLRQVWEDDLTGIHNRRYLEMRLPEEYERARRFGHDLSVVMMDVDDFKAINDRLSHPIGDQVLRAVARILKSVSRSVDIVVRYGGDEFLLAMIEAGPQQAAQVCERLREAVEDYDWATIHPNLAVTLSMGLCSLNCGLETADLVACADKHLYSAKREGKNRIAVGC